MAKKIIEVKVPVSQDELDWLDERADTLSEMNGGKRTWYPKDVLELLLVTEMRGMRPPIKAQDVMKASSVKVE